jgi:hypothetical protein
MIYATADTDPCIPIDNLSTAHKHYKTYTNLCSTTKSTLETICNLSTAYDLQHTNRMHMDRSTSEQDHAKEHGACGTPDNLSSNTIHPF